MGVIEVVFPVFSIVALGYLLASFKRIDIPTISEIAVNVTSPCLIFVSIAKREIVPTEWLTMGGAAVAVTLGTGALMVVYQRIAGVRMRGLYLPAMFLNSGNMALPFALLAFGTEGFDKAIIFYIATALLTYSIGVTVAKGAGGLREIFRLPLIYAALAGLGFSVFGLQLPKFLATPVGMLADTAIPIMIINLGVQLRSLTISDLHHASAAVTIRMGGGVLLGLLYCLLLGIAGVSRNVILLDSIMPPAVFNVILAQKYDANPEAVASAIVIGTLLSVATTSVLLLFIS